ncbi:MAG: hypothetical protein Q8N04_10395 [Nitrospira sp.]|nr:hypothetical protein [Nitrospira sp.]
MKSPTALSLSTRLCPLSLCLLTSALLTGVGCVSQQTYDKTKDETNELTRALDATRTDITELEQRIAALKAANRQEDAVATELRAAIQREEETLPVLRKRAEEKLAALQTQVATLVNQSRLLAREMADAKQEGVSLQAMVTQHKQEMEESRALLTPITPATSAQTPPTVTPVAPSITPISPAVPPQQTAQAAPTAPVKPATAPRPAKVEPAPADESWTDWIKNRVSSIWSWIFN